ncbi:MAG: FeoA family protein [Putridiphycobacter sp.]|jgi:ferrous iron transport protein A|nr:FeoA family protein [Putridiphycobacter sp.]
MVLPLSKLKSKIVAKILLVENERLNMKLVELGIMPGVQLSVQNKAPFKGPLSILVNGTKVIIRSSEADFILVETD